MTIRRDKLLRLALAGKLVAVGSYHSVDNDGSVVRKNVGYPVRILSEYGECQEGFYNMAPDHFRSRSGCAFLSDDRMMARMTVDSNCYEFAMADGSAFAGNGATPKAHRPEDATMHAS